MKTPWSCMARPVAQVRGRPFASWLFHLIEVTGQTRSRFASRPAFSSDSGHKRGKRRLGVLGEMGYDNNMGI